MLTIGTLVIMLAAAYASYRNGLFTSVAMLFMTLISGLVAFGFWEPLSNLFDLAFQQNLRALAGAEDFVVLTLLFGVSFLLMRLAYQYLAPEMIDEHGALQHFGGAFFGLIMGYLVSGVLICAMQTLPLDERFLDFQPREPGEPGWRSLFPGDRLWLAMMKHASSGSFSWKEDKEEGNGGPVTFDREATFELRYMRYRRTTDSRPALPYLGEFDREIGKYKPK